MIDLIKVINKMQVKLFRAGNYQFLRHLPVCFVIFSDLKVKLKCTYSVEIRVNFKGTEEFTERLDHWVLGPAVIRWFNFDPSNTSFRNSLL